jgi:hypothetical protein
MYEQLKQAAYSRFLNSPTTEAHAEIRKEIVAELHLDFETRENGVHAVCMLCRGSVAQLTAKKEEHEAGYVFTLDQLASLFMAHFMNRHYEQEGRRG